jgi:hypothetical protein
MKPEEHTTYILENRKEETVIWYGDDNDFIVIGEPDLKIIKTITLNRETNIVLEGKKYEYFVRIFLVENREPEVIFNPLGWYEEQMARTNQQNNQSKEIIENALNYLLKKALHKADTASEILFVKENVWKITSEYNKIVHKKVQAERKKVIEECIAVVKETMSEEKVDDGHDCYEVQCEYCDNLLQNDARGNILTKLRNMIE